MSPTCGNEHFGIGRRGGVFVYVLFFSLCLLTYLFYSFSVSPLQKKTNKKQKREWLLFFFLNPPLVSPFSSDALITMNPVTHVFHQLLSMERAEKPGDSRWSEYNGQNSSQMLKPGNNAKTHTAHITSSIRSSCRHVQMYKNNNSKQVPAISHVCKMSASSSNYMFIS